MINYHQIIEKFREYSTRVHGIKRSVSPRRLEGDWFDAQLKLFHSNDVTNYPYCCYVVCATLIV